MNSLMDGCIDALAICNETLHGSLATLTATTQDTARLNQVLTAHHSFEFVSEHEILDAKLGIQREVEPQIKELIQRGEGGLEALQRKERKMNELAETRKQQSLVSQADASSATTALFPTLKQTSATTMEVAKARARMMVLQTQKETLMKATDRAAEEIRSKKVLLELE